MIDAPRVGAMRESFVARTAPMVHGPMIIRGLIERRAAGHHSKSRPVDDR